VLIRVVSDDRLICETWRGKKVILICSFHIQFRPVCILAKTRCPFLISSLPSVCPHLWNGLPLNGFSFHFSLESVIKICQEIRNFVTIWQKISGTLQEDLSTVYCSRWHKIATKAMSLSEMVSGYEESWQRYTNYSNAPHFYVKKHCLSWSSWYWSTFQITAS